MSWSIKPLGECLTLKRGYDLPGQARILGDVPIVSSSGITGKHNEAKVEGPGVITGRYGTLGKVFYVETPFWPLNTSLYVRDFKGNNPRFVSYFLKHVLRGTQSNKAAVPGVNRNELHSRDVHFPTDFSTQQSIVSVLSAYDDLIENNRRRIQLLEESARLLYKEWFVYLRFPGHEHTTITDGVPEGWERNTISDIAAVYRGKSYKSSELRESDARPFVNLKCIERYGGYRSSGLKYFEGECKEHHIVRGGDIVMAVTDMTRERMIVARSGIVPKNIGEGAVYTMDLVKIIPKAASTKLWFYSLLRHSSFADEVKEYATGVNVLHLKPKYIEQWSLAIPPESLRHQFEQHASPIFEQQENMHQQIRAAEAARDLLLPRLMRGELVA